MKGTILVCLRDMLRQDHNLSNEQWHEMLTEAGLNSNRMILASGDIDDSLALALFGAAQKRFFNDEHEKLATSFGRYWTIHYAPKIYSSVYNQATNTREFLLKMDDVHVMVTKTIANSKPPRFTYENEGDDTLLINYSSERGLIHLFAGLCKGLAEYFNEPVKVDVRTPTQLSVKFLAAS